MRACYPRQNPIDLYPPTKFNNPQPMSDLLSSRWAPGASSGYRYNYTYNNNNYPRRPRSENRTRSDQPPTYTYTPNPGSNTLLPPQQELARFMKIVARLRWKLPFLAEGYRLATQSTDNGVSAAEVAHAEIMFKIDFYEYYALLERAIVHLLGVFNIAVSSAAGAQYRGNHTGFENGYGRGVGIHRYHANVLQALEEETTPLTPILGNGHVHALLKKAKELRNRWKTADMTREERENDPYERKEVLPLASFDFDEIFMGIFQGLEEGYVRAKDHVEMCRKPGEVEVDAADVMDEEAEWRFMVEGMDWEAV